MADLPDPSTLSDEDLDKILNGEDLNDDSDENQDDQGDADDDQNVDDSGKQDDDQDDDADDDGGTDDNKADDQKEDDSAKSKTDDKQDKPSPREARRIQQLLAKYPDLDKQPAQPKTPEKPADALDYKASLDADEDTIKKLESDREQYGKTQYNAGLEQAKSIMFHTRLEIDAPRVEAKYPFLDKNSDKFKPEAAQDVNTLYLTLAGFDPKTGAVKNPDLRYSDFVDTINALAKDLAADEAKEITKNVKRQAAKTGLRPDGSSAKPKLNLNKAPQDMTDEELDEYLKQAIPS